MNSAEEARAVLAKAEREAQERFAGGYQELMLSTGYMLVPVPVPTVDPDGSVKFLVQMKIAPIPASGPPVVELHDRSIPAPTQVDDRFT